MQARIDPQTGATTVTMTVEEAAAYCDDVDRCEIDEVNPGSTVKDLAAALHKAEELL
jgi:hypothetical protein